MISKTLTSELNKILKTDFGLRLPKKEVKKLGNKLTAYFDLLAQMEYEKANAVLHK